ncbi:hypothetical protein ACQ4PT_051822 [Festuca glaucescens]
MADVDGYTSPAIAVEADVDGDSSPAIAAEADVDGDSSPTKPGLAKPEDELYVESLVGVSLLLVSEEFPLEVQLHGSTMLQHLVDQRSGQLSAAQLLNLKIQLVESATSSSPIFLSTVKRTPGFEDGIRVGLSLVLDPHFISSPTSPSLYPPSVSQDETTLETIFHYSKERLLLLTEHNLLCEGFRIATSLLGTAQCSMIIPRLLDPLNKIRSLQGWKYFASHNGVGQLFSDGQFLEIAYHVVGFCEEQLERHKTQEPGGASDILLSVPLLGQILPLLLRLLQRVHALWDEEVDDLPEEIERAKSLRCVELATTLESTDGLYDADSLHKDKTGALLEGTRQRAYNVLGLCTSIEGAFSDLLDSLSVRHALSEDMGSMELRHLSKDSAGFAENNFTAWLTKKKKYLQVKALSAAKELVDGSDWNWEFEDEFRRYLPAYMDMVQQVDSINDYEEPFCVEQEWLFQILKPEFRYKYGMNSCEHHYMSTIFSVWRRKDSIACTMVNRNKGKVVCELLKLKPYIKVSDSSSAIVHRLKENPEIRAGLPDFAVKPSVSYLRGLLLRWEPVFHPLIRESHMDLLLWAVDQYTKWNESKFCQQVEPDASDFELHLQPYAQTFFETRLKEKKYHIATEQIRLHKKFDSYLASGVLDIRMDVFRSSKDDFVKDLVQNEMARMQLSDLHHELIILSLERRDELVKIQHQVIKYSECLRSLFYNELLKGQLGVLMNGLETQGFFDTGNDSVNWENKLFLEHVDKFNNLVFARHRLPKHYVIRGIIDYRSISMCKDCSWQSAFEAVVDEKCERWIDSCEEFWMKSSYYEHLYYDIVRRALEHVFL